mmetsp:Transcript_17161/g.23148  ORF Transcript_17161/g.23148 Transcript_17161/m.23148 type:complete len:112 (-) Transcript_17161:113-448(-)
MNFWARCYYVAACWPYPWLDCRDFELDSARMSKVMRAAGLDTCKDVLRVRSGAVRKESPTCAIDVAAERLVFTSYIICLSKSWNSACCVISSFLWASSASLSIFWPGFYNC